MAIKLSAPWDEYYQEIKAFFARDDGVNVVYDRDKYEIKLYVKNGGKADALETLLIHEKEFGNVKLNITVIPPNDHKAGLATMDRLFQNALTGNPAFRFAITAQLTYVVFAPDVVQYFTDNLGDWNGFRSTLYQEMAKEIFAKQDGVYYCTDKADKALNAWM